jgi:hypothetical protein
MVPDATTGQGVVILEAVDTIVVRIEEIVVLV